MTVEHPSIDAERAHREWVKSFTWHLDVVPPLIEVIVWMTFPSVKSSRFDQIRVTGGGFIDNVPDVLENAVILQDARTLWSWVVNYTRAVADWIEPTRPAPILEEQPNADPLLARSIALTTVGWLIDHADQVHAVAELDDHTAQMFNEIRHLRGRYGVFPKPRPQRDMCGVCGERKVASTWMPNPNGSAKPLRVNRCASCGETTSAPAEVIPVRSVSITLSEACAELAHERCESVHCECTCGHGAVRQP